MYYNIIVESTGDDDDIVPPTHTSHMDQRGRKAQRNTKSV